MAVPEVYTFASSGVSSSTRVTGASDTIVRPVRVVQLMLTQAAIAIEAMALEYSDATGFLHGSWVGLNVNCAQAQGGGARVGDDDAFGRRRR